MPTDNYQKVWLPVRYMNHRFFLTWIRLDSYYAPLGEEFRKHVTRTPRRLSSLFSTWQDNTANRDSRGCHRSLQVRGQRGGTELEVISTSMVLVRKLHWHDSLPRYLWLAHRLGKWDHCSLFRRCEFLSFTNSFLGFHALEDVRFGKAEAGSRGPLPEKLALNRQ